MITLYKEDAFTIVDIISKAQEVIRCKDCKYWDDDLDGYCTLNDCFNWDADDFCCGGEKKDE